MSRTLDFANFRDVSTASDRLREGVVWRADAPMHANAPTGLAVWPPSLVLDLRDPNERGAGHPLEPHTRVESIPVLADASPTQVAGYNSLADLYEVMLVGAGARAMVRIVDQVATAPGGVLIHCTAGKDRTGVSVALLLTLAGVDRDAVVADYVATAANMHGVLANMMVTLAGVDAIATPGYDVASIPPQVLAAPAEAIERVLDVWDAAPGGAEGWLVSAGGDAATVARLRERLLLA